MQEIIKLLQERIEEIKKENDEKLISFTSRQNELLVNPTSRDIYINTYSRMTYGRMMMIQENEKILRMFQAIEQEQEDEEMSFGVEIMLTQDENLIELTSSICRLINDPYTEPVAHQLLDSNMFMYEARMYEVLSNPSYVEIQSQPHRPGDPTFKLSFAKWCSSAIEQDIMELEESLTKYHLIDYHIIALGGDTSRSIANQISKELECASFPADDTECKIKYRGITMKIEKQLTRVKISIDMYDQLLYIDFQDWSSNVFLDMFDVYVNGYLLHLDDKKRQKLNKL